MTTRQSSAAMLIMGVICVLVGLVTHHFITWFGCALILYGLGQAVIMIARKARSTANPTH